MSHRLELCRFKKNFLVLTTLIISLFIASPAFAASQLQKVQSKTQLNFIKNTGQKDSQVAYYAQTLGGTVFITQKGELVYSLPKETEQGPVAWAFKETFVTTNDLNPNQANKKQFVSELSLGQIAPGIQLKLASQGNNVEKLFYLSAGADVANIKVALDGINGSHLNKEGQLVLETGLGPIAFTKPVAFQMNGGKKELVAVSYTLNNNQYGFSLGDYDHSKKVVIDPLLASTFFGGSGFARTDRVSGVISTGDFIYVAGTTSSPDFPTALGYDSVLELYSAGYILRFSSDLSTLVNGTFIGTAVFALELDIDGTLVTAGQSGTQFPISEGAYSIPYTIFDSAGFIARFSADLTTLISSSVVIDEPYITVLELGNGSIYFGRSTTNPDLPVTENVFGPNCFCPIIGAYELREMSDYIGRLSADFTTLEALSYIPHVNMKQILVAPDSSIYVSGSSVAHYDGDLTVQYGVTDNNIGTRGIALGDGFLAGVGVTSRSNIPVTSDSYDSTCGTDGNCDKDPLSQTTTEGRDAFVIKYSLDLQNVLAATYIGGSVSDELNYVAVDDVSGDIIVAGNTYSSDFPTTSTAHDRTFNGVRDVVIARFSSDLSRLLYSSYIGSADTDIVGGLSLDSSGYAFIAGETSSGDFPTTADAFSTVHSGGDSDGFISQINTLIGSADPTPEPDPTPDPDPTPVNEAPVADAGSDQDVGSRDSVYLDGSASSDSDGSIVSYQWTQVSGKSSKLSNADEAVANFRAPRLRKGRTYTLVFELEVTDDQGATSIDQVTVEVR